MNHGNMTIGRREPNPHQFEGLSSARANLHDGEVQPQASMQTEKPNILIVSVECSFANRIALGQYECTNPTLTEKRFPVTADQVGEWECKLFHFERDVASNEVTLLMLKEGFELGQIGHHLAFGEQYPEEQRKYPILALGSVAEIAWYRIVLYRLVPVLWGDDSRRVLGLFWDGRDWGQCCRFLGVRRRLAS